MLDAGHRVCRLAPDGTCAPQRSLREPHHESDGSTCAGGRVRTHGAERSSELFAVGTSRQAPIAGATMAGMGTTAEANGMPAAGPSQHGGMAAGSRPGPLGDEVAAGIGAAGRPVASMPAGPAGAAEGDG